MNVRYMSDSYLCFYSKGVIMKIIVANILSFSHFPKSLKLLASCSRALKIEHEPNEQSSFEQKSSNELNEHPYFPKQASNVKQRAACYPSLGHSQHG